MTMKIKMIMKMKMKIINVVVQILRLLGQFLLLLFFYKRYFKYLKHKQKRIQVNISSIDTEVIRTVFILIIIYKRYFKHLKHKQKKHSS